MKLLSRIDAFGIRPSLLMDSHSKYQTIICTHLSSPSMKIKEDSPI